jgi:hypothetical protein
VPGGAGEAGLKFRRTGSHTRDPASMSSRVSEILERLGGGRLREARGRCREGRAARHPPVSFIKRALEPVAGELHSRFANLKSRILSARKPQLTRGPRMARWRSFAVSRSSRGTGRPARGASMAGPARSRSLRNAAPNLYATSSALSTPRRCGNVQHASHDARGQADSCATGCKRRTDESTDPAHERDPPDRPHHVAGDEAPQTGSSGRNAASTRFELCWNLRYGAHESRGHASSLAFAHGTCESAKLAGQLSCASRRGTFLSSRVENSTLEVR